MPDYDFARILVAVDGSEGSWKALVCAISLCERLESELTVVAVEGKLPAYAASIGEVDEVRHEKDRFFGQVLETATTEAEERGISVSSDLIPGHAAEVITHYAKSQDHDLIVIGHKGHFLGDYLLGSTADRVAHHAHCPVIVVR